MRNYPTNEVWPANRHEAHVMLVRAFWHLKNSEKAEFESLDARFQIQHLMEAVMLEAAA